MSEISTVLNPNSFASSKAPLVNHAPTRTPFASGIALT